MDLPVTDPLGSRFCEIFPYRWASLESTAPVKDGARWRTVKKYPLKPRTLWARYKDPSQLVGVRFAHTTTYGLIDIDSGSPYISRLPEIAAALETIGIVRWVPLRSSSSGGLHLYIPLPEPVATFSLACALRQALEAQGMEIAAGQLEIFPNTKAHGKSWLGEFTEYNGHRLPLQPHTGSCILGADLEPIGDSLSLFFAHWDNAAAQQDPAELAQALTIARNNHRKRPRRQNLHPVTEWRNDLERDISEGWTGPGQTNAMLKAIACYGRVFEQLEGSALAQYVERMAVTRPGYLDHCQHQREITAKARSWANAAERYYWPLGSAPAREVATYSPNAESMAEARERIRVAAAQLRLDPPTTIRALASRLVELARCSMKTLYRHLDLWHPELGVTAQPEGILAALAELRGDPPGSAQTTVNRGVTPDPPFNEGCSLKELLKFTLPEGWGGGAGGGEGLSTGFDHV